MGWVEPFTRTVGRPRGTTVKSPEPGDAKGNFPEAASIRTDFARGPDRAACGWPTMPHGDSMNDQDGRTP